MAMYMLISNKKTPLQILMLICSLDVEVSQVDSKEVNEDGLLTYVEVRKDRVYANHKDMIKALWLMKVDLIVVEQVRIKFLYFFYSLIGIVVTILPFICICLCVLVVINFSLS